MRGMLGRGDGLKKTNPNRKPCTQKDVDRAFQRGQDQGIKLAIVIFLTVILDKYEGKDYIESIWKDCNKLSEEIAEGRVNLRELMDVMKGEYNVDLCIK